MHLLAPRKAATRFSLIAALAVAGCVHAPHTSQPAPQNAPALAAQVPQAQNESLQKTALTPAEQAALPDDQPQDPLRDELQDQVQSSRSALSVALSSYYANVQADLLRNDLLRTDGGGEDTPFSTHQLAANFDAIALNDEYTTVNGEFVAQTTPSNLHRWDVPVYIGTEFGESVPDVQQSEDSAMVAALTTRLARATGHPVSYDGLATNRTNFHVLVLNEDERRTIGPRLSQLIPGLTPAAIRSVENMPRSSYCLVIASDPADNGAYRQAVAVIRGEHPDLMRQSCFHEEIAQGLGLANDNPRARPSIFNDDEEFALLTRHDELLLRILYDDRLRPGMSPEVARHISAQIARDVAG